MTASGRLVHLLRNAPVRELIRALERDGFYLQRTTRTGAFVYRHPDGRGTFIHYHTGGETLTRKTLSSIVRAARWWEGDLRRLGLMLVEMGGGESLFLMGVGDG